MMRISPTRAYTWVASLGLFLQGTVTLAALLVPAVDGAMPVILGETQMVASHSLLHIVGALIGFAVLRVGGPPGTRRFALGFGLFYVGLGIAGAFTGQPLLLSLKPFDHPFHIVLGGLGLLAVTAEIAMPRAASRNNK